MLDVKDLRFGFPGRNFHFCLHLPDRSLTAIVGPSGGGKSTLLHLLAGFEQPQAGRIVFDGEDVTNRHPSKRPLSIIFQDNNLFPHLSAFENVALGLMPSLKLSSEDRVRVEATLARVGLADAAHKKPGELSGGERQRLAIARTALRDRPLLLLDEAFAALGPALRRDMLHLVKSMHNDRGLTTLMVTHSPEDARAIATHVAFVAQGEVKAFGTTSDMLDNSSNSELQTYLGELP
jgi:thiamine transport system ATP-binding protein